VEMYYILDVKVESNDRCSGRKGTEAC